jgi:GH24 family phage-related lysozyme (muramidase)
MGNYEAAAKEFPRWNKAGGKVLRGLTRRREAEKQLFLTGEVDLD